MSGSLCQDLSTFYCCQWHISLWRHCGAALCFYVIDGVMWLNSTYRMCCCVSVATLVRCLYHKVSYIYFA